MSFPINPSDGQSYKTVFGNRFVYNASDNKWVKDGLYLGDTGLQGVTGLGGLGNLVNISFADVSTHGVNTFSRIHNGVASEYGYVVPMDGKILTLGYTYTVLMASGGEKIGLYINNVLVYSTPDILNTSSLSNYFEVNISFNSGDYINVGYIDPESTTFASGTNSVVNLCVQFGSYVAGPTGPIGPIGVKGYTGIRGDTGAQGYTGAYGLTGTQGYTGSQGYTGIQGLPDTGQLILLSAGGWPSETNGCGYPEKVEYGASGFDMFVMPFDPDTNEYAEWTVITPSDWSGTSVTAIFYWTHSSGSGNVRWGIQGRGYANNVAIDSAWGTAVEVLDGSTGVDRVNVSSESSTITITGTAASRVTQFRVYRDAIDGTDTLSDDARLLAVRIYYNRI